MVFAKANRERRGIPAGLLAMDILNNEVRFEYHVRTNETRGRKLYVSTDIRIVYVHGGRAEWKIKEAVYHVKAGSLLLLSNTVPRIIVEIDPDCPLEFMVLNISPRFLFRIGFLRLFTEMKGVSPVMGHCPEDIVSLFKKVKSEYDCPALHTQTMIAAAALMILVYLSRERGVVAEPNVIEPRIKNVLDYIDNNFNERIYLSRLSKMANMNTDVFSRCFKKCNGITVCQYIRNKRIARAIDLIESTDSKILDIAFRCGYENMANFYKAFRAVTGKHPSELRNPVPSRTGRP
jgi:AraC-like DNA-binding protein